MQCLADERPPIADHIERHTALGCPSARLVEQANRWTGRNSHHHRLIDLPVNALFHKQIKVLAAHRFVPNLEYALPTLTPRPANVYVCWNGSGWVIDPTRIDPVHTGKNVHQ